MFHSEISVRSSFKPSLISHLLKLIYSLQIAWLFNIRGSDISYNPVTLSYAVVTLEGVHLFIDSVKIINPSVMAHLAAGLVTVHGYGEVEEFLRMEAKDGKVVIDPAQLNWQLCQAIESSNQSGNSIIRLPSPITIMKAVKNDSELNGIRNCHVRDGAALTAFLYWLEKTVKDGENKITEYDVAVKIEEYRAKSGMHVGPSFDTIAGFGANGAIIHYKPAKETAAVLGTGAGAMFLLDSGAQYLDGTTDVTRTLHFGVPTEREKMCYTLVLKVRPITEGQWEISS